MKRIKINYQGQDRYQFQPWHIKAMRWLRWRPWFAAISLYYILRNRRHIYGLSYWGIGKAMAQGRMGHHWTKGERHIVGDLEKDHYEILHERIVITSDMMKKIPCPFPDDSDL